MVRFGRVDANQKPIVRTLSSIPGVSVKVLSDVGKGMTDLLIGRMGINYLIELKDGEKVKSKQKLTDDQVEFHSEHGWKGQKAVCNCLEQVLEVIGITQGA